MPIQCVDLQAALACGHGNGSVSVRVGDVALSIKARQQRNCTSVKLNNNLLAIGLEKVRNDSSLTIYDIAADAPIGQFAGTEGVSSLAWFPDAPNYILAGLNYRWLRLIDVRSDPKDGFAISIPTKSVFNLTVDLDTNRFASSHNDTITIWDRRSTTPDLVLAGSSPVRQLHYSRSARSHLCCLRDDFDLYALDGDRSNIRVTKHNTFSLQATDFDFTETSPWSVLYLDGDVKSKTFDTTAPVVHLGSKNDIVLANSSALLFANASMATEKENEIETLQYDISTTMYRRAHKRYEMDAEHNASLDPALATVWTWMAETDHVGALPTWMKTRDRKATLKSIGSELASEDIDMAAFYAVVDGDITKAVHILDSGDSIHRIIGAAIAGGRGTWRESCKRLAFELDSPYIRAIFAYVSGDWQDVLDEQSLTLRERLVVAVKHLKDDDLTSTLKDMLRTEMSEGNLEGLLIAGLDTKLLQIYVNRTADIQTAALLTPEESPWVAEYRNLLNKWGMFHARCRFDVARSKRIKTRIPRQLYIRCNGCNANITHRPGKSKTTACPNCRKSLPKCALCLMSCGNEQLFNFCLSCSHSLHSDHAEAWFKLHDECPVSSCSCQCNRL